MKPSSCRIALSRRGMLGLYAPCCWPRSRTRVFKRSSHCCTDSRLEIIGPCVSEYSLSARCFSLSSWPIMFSCCASRSLALVTSAFFRSSSARRVVWLPPFASSSRRCSSSISDSVLVTLFFAALRTTFICRCSAYQARCVSTSLDDTWKELTCALMASPLNFSCSCLTRSFSSWTGTRAS